VQKSNSLCRMHFSVVQLKASAVRQDLEPILIPNDAPTSNVTPQVDPQPNPVLDPAQPIPDPSTPSRMAIPAEFDARRLWGGTCASLYDIRDQAGCGSCWYEEDPFNFARSSRLHSNTDRSFVCYASFCTIVGLWLLPK
jgi:hypothetical protein